MFAAIYLGRKRTIVQQIDPPVCGQGDLPLEVELADICGTDVKTYFHAARGRLNPPHIIGHEVAARIVEVGPAARLQPNGELILINADFESRLEMARRAGIEAEVCVTAAQEDPVQRCWRRPT